MLTQYHQLNALNYQDVWDFQTILHNSIKAQKRFNAKLNSKNKSKKLNHVVFCEHNHVITLGKSASEANLLSDLKNLKDSKIELFKINRGGDITYHGPGQLTGYLIFDVEQLYRDVHLYVRNIEECIIRLLDAYGLEGVRKKTFTGVWLDDAKGQRKICAIGVHLSRWVSMHGFGFNVNTDLNYFKNIVPCGIVDDDKSVTSLAAELGHEVNLEELQLKLRRIVKDIFGLEYINI